MMANPATLVEHVFLSKYRKMNERSAVRLSLLVFFE